MKKYFLYLFCCFISYGFLNTVFDPSQLIRVKYLYTLYVGEYCAFLLYQISNIVFVYMSIMDYISIHDFVLIRSGKKGYAQMLIKRCLMTFLMIVSVHSFFDWQIFHLFTLYTCIADVLFLITICLSTHFLFKKRDIQSVISVVIICILRNIFLHVLLV